MLTEQMRSDLRAALLARDEVVVAALRSALAAVANAEAQPLAATATTRTAVTGATSEHVAGAAVGLGAAEVERKQLSPADVLAVVVREVDEGRAAARELRRAGRTDRADRADAEADVLGRYLLERDAPRP